MQHPFDAAVALTPKDDHTFTGATHPAYANMVGPYGGITSATLLQAALVHPARLGAPIALTVNFAGPIADGPFTVEAGPARTNRSTQHWQIALSQDGVVGATATAVFAERRSTWSAPEARPPADLPPPDAVPAAAPPDRLPWVSRYEMRFIDGAFPDPLDGVEQPEATTRVWLRDEPPRPLDFPALASLCDAFFPRVFSRRRLFGPAGTVTMTSFFHADDTLLAAQGTRHVLGVARGLNYRNGYFDQSAEIWGEDGQLLASTHQMVYFRDPPTA